MKCDYTQTEISAYTARQLNHFFPMGRDVQALDLEPFVGVALERVERCFQHIRWPSYSENGQARFDPLHSDQWCAYLYLLSNTLWHQSGDRVLAGKLFSLNKALHAFNCMYDTQLPEIFWLVHTVGTVLGKADYKNHLVVLQNCTVGAVRGEFPTLSEKLVLSAGASIIGPGHVGHNVTVGPNVCLYKPNIPDNTIVVGPSDWTHKPNSKRSISSFFHFS